VDCDTRRIVLYPFSWFDLRRRKWTRGRYVAQIDALAERYDCFRIEGKPEVRDVPLDPLELTFDWSRRS
jgi:hypothetical protein